MALRVLAAPMPQLRARCRSTQQFPGDPEPVRCGLLMSHMDERSWHENESRTRRWVRRADGDVEAMSKPGTWGKP